MPKESNPIPNFVPRKIEDQLQTSEISQMDINERRKFLDERFIEVATLPFPDDPNYIVVPEFNIIIPNDVGAAMQLEFLHTICEKTDIQRGDGVFGVPNAGLTIAGIASRSLGLTLYNTSRKGDETPGSWDWGEILKTEVHSRTTEKKTAPLQLGFIEEGLRILLIDDVCGTGKTIIKLIKSLQKKGVTVVGVGVIFDKEHEGGAKKIEKETGVPVASIVTVQNVKDGEIILKPREMVEIDYTKEFPPSSVW